LSSGPVYRNFLVWVERAGSPCATGAVILDALGASQFTGIIYAPCSKVHFEVEGPGTGTMTIIGQVVANVIEFWDQDAVDNDQRNGMSAQYAFYLEPPLYGARLVNE
jgi:hypothetical protein